MCFEDMALMRTVPGACVIDVTDAVMFYKLLKATKDWPGVTYFRTPRRGAPDVYSEDSEFCVGKGCVLTEGKDATVVASGIMTATALEAAKLLHEQGISVRVVDPITVKPLDEDLLLRCAAQTGAIVTAENHNVVGGLGGAVAECISEQAPVPVLKVGVADRFGQTGSVDFLREEYGLTAKAIVEKVRYAVAHKAKV